MEHSFDIKIAEKHGVNIAIIVKNFDFWLSKNKANGKNFKDGTYWTYNSVKAFKQLFPYFTERQINHTLGKMEEKLIIETGVYNINSYDRTKWYTFHKLFMHENRPILQFCQIDSTEASNEFNTNVNSLHTDNKPNDKPDNICVLNSSVPVKNKTEETKQEYLDYWISKKESNKFLRSHKTTQFIKNKHIKETTIDEFKAALDIYCEIVSDDSYWYNKPYGSIGKFLDNIDKWLDEDVKQAHLVAGKGKVIDVLKLGGHR